jgi:hypothetical protein
MDLLTVTDMGSLSNFLTNKQDIKMSKDIDKQQNTEKHLQCKSHVGGIMRSADVNILDSDIATIEALHDLLLDAHGYSLDFTPLKKARELTAKMYKALF